MAPSKRVFTSSKQEVMFGEETCLMLMMHEQHGQKKIEGERRQLKSIEISDSCITKQITEALLTIITYIDLLVE